MGKLKEGTLKDRLWERKNWKEGKNGNGEEVRRESEKKSRKKTEVVVEVVGVAHLRETLRRIRLNSQVHQPKSKKRVTKTRRTEK